MVMFHFILLAQICTQTGCYTQPQVGDVGFNSVQECEKYKQTFINMAVQNKFKYTASCEEPGKTPNTQTNGTLVPFPKYGL